MYIYDPQLGKVFHFFRWSRSRLAAQRGCFLFQFLARSKLWAAENRPARVEMVRA
jgi:hypothetical protein